jgi:hypothetical protein
MKKGRADAPTSFYTFAKGLNTPHRLIGELNFKIWSEKLKRSAAEKEGCRK